MRLGKGLSVFLIIVVASVAAIFLLELTTPAPRQTPCSQPAGGYLIVASSTGYNDSVDRLNFTGSGIPSKPWPLITVSKGSTVRITVCNLDVDPHGFQIDHYYADNIVSIAPGRAISLSFSANETGTFRIFCQIPCPIHIFMQYGALVVR